MVRCKLRGNGRVKRRHTAMQFRGVIYSRGTLPFLWHDQQTPLEKERNLVILMIFLWDSFASERTALYTNHVFSDGLPLSSLQLGLEIHHRHGFQISTKVVAASAFVPLSSRVLHGGLCLLPSGLQHLFVMTRPFFGLLFLHNHRLQTAKIDRTAISRR